LPQTALIADVVRHFGTQTLAECRQKFAHADCC
jgi:hypothetical protein